MPRRLEQRSDVPGVAGALRRLIVEDGRSVEKIALAAGIERSHLYAIVAGIKPRPGPDTVSSVLAALGKNQTDL
jgi:hypothetical protein